MEILFETNRKIYEEYFSLDKMKFLRKRFLFAFIFIFLAVAVYVSTANIWGLIAMPIVGFLGYKVPYIELINRKGKEDLIKQYMFPTFLRYFISLLDTQGNVYQTLKATVPYMKDPLKTEVASLVLKLEKQNVNSRDAFMDFAEYIGSSEAHMVMGMIYEFNEEGISKDDIRELEDMIKNLQENKTDELIEQKVLSMDKHANPIMVYGLIFVFAFTILVFISYLDTLPI